MSCIHCSEDHNDSKDKIKMIKCIKGLAVWPTLLNAFAITLSFYTTVSPPKPTEITVYRIIPTCTLYIGLKHKVKL